MPITLYPLTFDPIYFQKPWGGRRLFNLFKRELLPGKTGESWEISVRPEAQSVINSGEFVGKTLAELCRMYPNEMFGEQADAFGTKFPLLYKFINAE